MKRLLISVSLGLLAIFFIVFQTYNVKRRAKKNYQIFYNSSLEGKISKIEHSVGAVYLKVENDNNKYSFIPIDFSNHPNQRFYDIIEKGDLLIKPKNSDTLVISKRKKVYKFLFQKF